MPVPAFATALAYYDALRRERLPAALIQGQRDFFGAHTYRRTDREGTFHTSGPRRAARSLIPRVVRRSIGQGRVRI